MSAYSPEERRLRQTIEAAVGPVRRRLEAVEKDNRRLKSQISNLQNQVARLKK